jgi:hypothetical protein
LDRDPEPTDTRLPTALVGLNGDDLVIIHSSKVLELCHASNCRPACARVCLYPVNPTLCNRVNFLTASASPKRKRPGPEVARVTEPDSGGAFLQKHMGWNSQTPVKRANHT